MIVPWLRRPPSAAFLSPVKCWNSVRTRPLCTRNAAKQPRMLGLTWSSEYAATPNILHGSLRCGRRSHLPAGRRRRRAMAQTESARRRRGAGQRLTRRAPRNRQLKFSSLDHFAGGTLIPKGLSLQAPLFRRSVFSGARQAAPTPRGPGRSRPSYRGKSLLRGSEDLAPTSSSRRKATSSSTAIWNRRRR